MRIQINGEPVELEREVNVTQLLTERSVKMPDMVSVELNGEILQRNAFAETIVKDSDTVEFLYFMARI